MRAQTCYWMVVLVYAGLWSCQMFVCVSTHSLIVLTDSYINLYYILEVISELFYLRVQSAGCCGKADESAYTILNRRCTYEPKRLPLLGFFINGLFLAALLMSAAIEGIQSCFHAHHLVYEGGKSILLENKLTYPGLLIGFACLGVMMRWLLDAAHRMGDAERAATAISRFGTTICDQQQGGGPTAGRAAAIAGLNDIPDVIEPAGDAGVGGGIPEGQLEEIILNPIARNKEFVEVALQASPSVTLKSFRVHLDSGDKLECIDHSGLVGAEARCLRNYKFRTLKHVVSPLALSACAGIVYFVTNDLITEIADAALAISVVIAVFIASYPSMKESGIILLQAVPRDVDLDSLGRDLRSISPLVSSVEELHVWTLASDTGKVGSCKLMIARKGIRSTTELAAIVRDARLKFLFRGITCSSVQPVLYCPTESDKLKKAR